MPAPFSKLIAAIKMANYQRLRKRREPQRIAYQKWVTEHDVMTVQKLALFKDRYASLGRTPVISIIMPVYNPPLIWLDEAIESVRNQIYQEWELCIADDCSSDPSIRPYLEEKGRNEPRIKLEFREKNGHISAASNSAIEIASGEFLALLDQDDLIPPHALLEIADCINQHPEACLIYSDEDKIDQLNQRESPTRKPDWDRNTLLRYNVISHLGVYQTALIRAIGGFRIGYEGSQDHDLALRCVSKILDNQIVHISKILYHWRIHSQSTALMASAKPYAKKSREKAISDFKKDHK